MGCFPPLKVARFFSCLIASDDSLGWSCFFQPQALSRGHQLRKADDEHLVMTSPDIVSGSLIARHNQWRNELGWFGCDIDYHSRVFIFTVLPSRTQQNPRSSPFSRTRKSERISSVPCLISLPSLSPVQLQLSVRYPVLQFADHVFVCQILPTSSSFPIFQSRLVCYPGEKLGAIRGGKLNYRRYVLLTVMISLIVGT